MSIRLSFHLDTVRQLADHAAAAVGHVHPARGAITGPALLLSSGTNGSWLASNGLPAPPAPAWQLGTLDRPAAFAYQSQPGTSWLDQFLLLQTRTPLSAVLPLAEPARRPLLDLLRAGATAGATTLIVELSGTNLAIAVGRHRYRACRPLPSH